MHHRSHHRPLGRKLVLLKWASAACAAVALGAAAAPAAHAAAVTPSLGTAADFAAVAGTTITNTGPSVINGDLGVSPGSAVVGFPPGTLNGTIYTGNDGPAISAAADHHTAFVAADQPCDQTLTDPDLGGDIVTPGVICFAQTGVGLTGTLTLDAQGDPNAAWIFKIGSTLTTASNSAVVLVNGASPCSSNNITWRVGSSATLGSTTSFVGNILASASVTLNTGATSTGGLYGHTGAVTMDSNRVSTCEGAGELAGPALSTTPSGSVPVGGSISDSATVIGGAAPTGTVEFRLHGPDDPDCTQTPLDVLTGNLVAGTAVSGDVTATAAGTYNWVAEYSGDTANAGATSHCGSEEVVVTAQTLTGRAYGLSANVALIGLPLVNIVPTPDTGFVSTPGSSTTSTPCVARLNGIVAARVLCANVTTDGPAGRSTASASVDDSTVGITLVPTIKVGAVQSTSTTTCSGSSGTTTIAYLKVGSTVVIAQPTNIAPNTQVNLGVVKLVLNEQIPFSTPDDGLTVNAVHVAVNVLGVVTANVVIASSESDIGNCP